LNIVFDLGGVVFNWRPDAIIASVFEDPVTQALVKAQIFQHPDWVELDRGTIDQDRAIVRGSLRTGLPRRDIERLFEAVPRSLTPIPGTLDLIQAIRAPANRLFVLSNMSRASISHLEREHKIWPLFDGAVISCRIKKVKPEIDIYEFLLSEFRLRPAETVFIDDMHENLGAAASIGIKTIRFVDPVQCRQDLVRLDVIEE
jgi:putative hydrolase of the HAD superfamily